MAFLDWIKRRKESMELKSMSAKYAHQAIGAPGAASRHFEQLKGARKEQAQPNTEKPSKTLPRPPASWER